MGIRARWAVIGGVLGCAIAIGVFVAFGGISSSSLLRQSVSAPAMLRQIQQLNELVTVKYAVQKVVGFEEKKIPVGSEKLLLIVQAEVMAGIELDKMTPEHIETKAGGETVISLPEPRILHVVIDDKETKVWDRRITWWTPWVPYNPDLERQARLSAREAIEKSALEMGILEAARKNVEAAIRQLAEGLGIKTVTFYRAT